MAGARARTRTGEISERNDGDAYTRAGSVCQRHHIPQDTLLSRPVGAGAGGDCAGDCAWLRRSPSRDCDEAAGRCFHPHDHDDHHADHLLHGGHRNRRVDQSEKSRAVSVDWRSSTSNDTFHCWRRPIGLVVGNVVRPGSGINVNVATLDAETPSKNYAGQAKAQSVTEFLMHIIRMTVVDAFAKGDILEASFVALLFGFALSAAGARAKPLVELIYFLTYVVFRIVSILMIFALIGALGAMAYTVGWVGLASRRCN